MGLTPDVQSGEIIQSAWGNEIRDRTLQVFATEAERDTQWADVPEGATCVTTDTGQMWFHAEGAWWPLAGLIRQAQYRGGVTVFSTSAAKVPVPAVPGVWTVEAGTLTLLRAGTYALSLAGKAAGAFQSRLHLTQAGVLTQINDVADAAGANTWSSVAYTTWMDVGDTIVFELYNAGAGAQAIAARASLVYWGAAAGPVQVDPDPALFGEEGEP